MLNFYRYIFLFIFFCLIFGCTEKKTNIPEGVMPPEQMTAFITDMQLIEAALIYVQQNGMDVNTYKIVFYNKLFEKHQISKEDFFTSMSFYTNNLNLLDQIFTDVITALSEKHISASN